jgi:hypothetical protein
MEAVAGKHLHMEESGRDNIVDFEKLVGILKLKGLTFSMDICIRFNPKIKKCVKKVQKRRAWRNLFGRGTLWIASIHLLCAHGWAISLAECYFFLDVT